MIDEIVALSNGRELWPSEDASVIHIGPQLKPADTAPTIETRTARRVPGMESDVLVPLSQAAITAVAVAIAAGLVSWAADWSWRVPVVAFALALVLGWLWRLRLVDRLLWQIETWTDHDIDGDGAKGRPTVSYAVANPGQARSVVARENRQEAEDAERAALLAFVDKCFISGCGEHAHGVKASGPARADYVARRDTLLSLGVAAWRFPGNPRGGWTMTCSRQRARQLVEKHVL